jgi:hypothetical protein
MFSDELNKYGYSHLYDSLSDPEYGHSSAANKSAFSYGVRHEIPNASLFDWYDYGHVRRHSILLCRSCIDVCFVARSKAGELRKQLETPIVLRPL